MRYMPSFVSYLSIRSSFLCTFSYLSGWKSLSRFSARFTFFRTFFAIPAITRWHWPIATAGYVTRRSSRRSKSDSSSISSFVSFTSRHTRASSFGMNGNRTHTVATRKIVLISATDTGVMIISINVKCTTALTA